MPESTDAPETIDAFCARLGLTIEVERTSPVPVPRYGRGTGPKRPWRCMQCDARIDPVTGAGLKRGNDRFPSTRGYVCEACDTLQIADEDAQTAWRVTIGREGTKRTHTTPYTMGSAYVFKGGPTLPDVVDSLRSDANCWRFAEDADDFIRDLGYLDGEGDALANVRQGEADYAACGATFRALCDLLGMAEAGHLLETIEGL